MSMLVCFVAAPAQAQKAVDSAGLKELTNQPSRKLLFDLIKKAEDDQAQKDGLEYFNLYGPFRYPNDALYDAIEKKERTDSIFGVDLSHYTSSKFPFPSLRRKEVKFAYLKATQGTGFKDGKFTQFWDQLDKLPKHQQVHRGAYHFLSAQKDAAAQAATYLKFLTAHGGLKKTDMPPVMDLEWDKPNVKGKDRWEDKTPDQIIAATRTWLELVEKSTGRKPMIYTSLAWWRARVGADRLKEFAAYPMWIADYSRTARATEAVKMPAGTALALWQYTESATMAAGFEGDFDSNIFKGTAAHFYKAFDVVPFEP